MSSNTTVVWSVKSINNGRKDSTTLSPLSLCCHHCHCVAQTLNILMFCRSSALRKHHNYLSICADKRSSSFTLRRNRGFHFWKVWKCNLGKKMNSSVLRSSTTCKVSLSISLSTTLSVRNQQLSGVPTYMCCCNLFFGVRSFRGGGCRCRGWKCGVLWGNPWSSMTRIQRNNSCIIDKYCYDEIHHDDVMRWVSVVSLHFQCFEKFTLVLSSILSMS